MTCTGFTRAAAAFGSAAALFLTPPIAAAEILDVQATPCAQSIRVRAQDAPLGKVIERIAQGLDVRLDARVDLAEPVSLSATGTPEEVLRRLMHGHNLVLDSNPVARCGGREVLTTVWLLPAGQEVSRPAQAEARTPVPVVQQPGEAVPVVRPPRPRGTRKRMSEAEWQQAKEDYKAGRTQADPETGLPVPVDPEAAQ